MNPNHYLATAISYLFANRPDWGSSCAVGKTIVSSGIIDRVAAKLGRKLVEVPVGFKWFVDGLIDGSLGFAGEESAGASFLRRDGSVWTTDKDGIILGLLAAEITAQTKRDPGEAYDDITRELGVAFYERIDAPATPEQKELLKIALARSDRHDGTCRRANTRDANRRAGQRPSVRRNQGDCRKRMVCRAAVRHRGCLQDLCRELPQRRSPAAHPAGGKRRRSATFRTVIPAAGKPDACRAIDRDRGGRTTAVRPS